KGVDVLIVPVRVQGEGAAQEIAAAVERVNRLAEPVDCLVVGRGGGSLEDLWAFNEEIVVRAIYASRIPVVSAVGHEIDVTLSDLVADVRALTPSEAAELVAPAADEIGAALRGQRQRLLVALRRRAALVRTRLDSIAGRRPFRKPFDLVHDIARRLDELSSRSNRALRQRLLAARRQTDGMATHLESLSPLAVLGRGYSLTQRLSDGLVVRDAARLSPGDLLTTRFSRGRAVSRVEQVEEDEG
ncbi:MAG TPA: exodeoxyribonuclease VII large subunit, partial [Pirellulales bacterium]|nr:exodeoxyribonuclease VII large subunit [Pirellulales bacterium]